MAELIRLDPGLLHEREPVVRKRSILFRENNITTVFDVLGPAAGEDGGDVFEFVPAAEVGAITHDTIIEKATSVAILCLFKSIDEVSEKGGAFLVTFARGFDSWLRESVVAERVSLELDPHAGEEGADRLAITDDVGHAGLKGHDDHVIHEMDRFLSGESFRRSLERSLGFWDISPFGLALEAFLDLPNAREIFVELFLIAFAQGALHATAIDTDEVENALPLLKAGVQFFTRIAGVGEELVKEIERTLDAGDGISGVIPRKRKPLSMAGIRTAIRFVRGKDEGRKAGLFPEMLCGNLVARNRVVKAFAGSARDIGSGEVGS